MSEELQKAVERAEQLVDRLRDTLEADAELEVTEDEIEQRLDGIGSFVRQHNDKLAEREIED